jgi:L-proline amide hydrolase
VPTLALRGEFDEAQERVVKPWLENIPDVREVVIRGGSHTAHLEYPFAYVKAIQTFLGRSLAGTETMHSVRIGCYMKQTLHYDYSIHFKSFFLQ